MAQSTAGIAIINKKVFIALRNPGGNQGNRWEFPGGKVDPGESKQESLAREWFEEFGLQIDVQQEFFESTFEHKGIPFSLHAFWIKLEINKPILLDEHQATKWASLEEIETLSLVDSDKPILDYLIKNRSEFSL